MSFDRFVEGDSLIINDRTALFIDIKELGSFLQSNTYIKKLSLIGLHFNDKDAKALANINLTNLTSLRLKVDSIHQYTYDLRVTKRNLIVKVFSEALKSSEHPNLTSLHLEIDGVDDSGVRTCLKSQRDELK